MTTAGTDAAKPGDEATTDDEGGTAATGARATPNDSTPPAPAVRDEESAWTSEVDAWSASLPILLDADVPASSEFDANERTNVEIEESLDELLESFDEPTAKAAAALAPVIEAEIETSRALASTSGRAGSPAPAALPTEATPPELESSGALVIPDLDELEAVTTGVGGPALVEPTPPPLPSRAASPTPPAATPTPPPWTATPESAIHFEWSARSAAERPGAERMVREALAGPAAAVGDGLPDLPELPGLTAAARPFAGPDLFATDPPPDELATLPEPSGRRDDGDLPAAAYAFDAPGVVPRPERSYWRDELARYGDEVSSALAAADFPRAAQMAVAAARVARRLGLAEIGVRLCDEALGYAPGFAPALRERWLIAYSGGRWDDALRSLAALAAAAPASERAAYAALLRELRAARGEQPEPSSIAEPATELGLGDELASAEEALRRGDRAAAAAPLERAGARIGGRLGAELTIVAARLLELAGAREEAGRAGAAALALDPSVPGATWGALREAARSDVADALAALEALVASAAPTHLRASVGRWAARLAHRAGDAARARAVLARALDGLPETTWSLEDHLWLGNGPEGLLDAATQPEDGGDGGSALDDDQRLVLAAHVAQGLAAAGQEVPALSELRSGLRARKDAVPLALIAETIARTGTSSVARASALALWGDHDPARRAHAHLLRAAAATPLSAVERDALAAASEADPADPAFWRLAWALLDDQRWAEAADALERGAGAWHAGGGEGVAAALRERAADLRLAELPARAVARALTLSARASIVPDHPRTLALTLLEKGRDRDAIAATFRAAAVSVPASRRRSLEAAAWLLHAGDRAAAAHVLLALAAAGELDDTGAVLLARLLPSARDPALARAIFARLEDRAGDARARALLAFRRAEALEAVGDPAAAFAVYRELLGGPLGAAADLALRRLLWSLRDREALDDHLRDEADARLGAGLDRAAAGVLVARAVLRAELFEDPATARELLAAAAARDPARVDVQLALLFEDAERGDAAAVFERLSALAAAAPGERARHRLELLALLYDAGRASGTREASSLGALQPRSDDELPLALAFRAFAASGGLAGTSDAAVAWAERLAERLARVPEADRRTSAVLLLRAAQARGGAGQLDEADRLARAAVERDPTNVAAQAELVSLLRRRGAWRQAAEALGREAELATVPAHRARALVAAAELMADPLGDAAAAESLLRRAMEADPDGDAAFAKLRGTLEARGDAAALADLLTARVKATRTPGEASELRLARVQLFVGPLRDRAAAKAELRSILLDDPQQLTALARLAELELEDGAHAVAAELYIRLARFERDPIALRDIFLRIGRIYHRRLSDPKLATGAFERVLRLDPSCHEALEALSELYTKQADVRRALAVTEQALDREADPGKRLTLLLRLADLNEKAGEGRKASALLRRAVDEHPRSLQAIGELARFYERTREVAGRNVLLDSAIARCRDDLRADLGDLAALRTIVPLLRWRQRTACSSAAAQIVGALSEDAAERREAALWAAPPTKGRRLVPLANPELEERLASPGVLAGARHLLRLAGPALARVSRPDLKRWGVGRGDRLDVGQGARALIDPLAVDLGVRGFDVYVSKQHPRALAVEPGDPPALVVGSELVALGPVAVRFAAGFGLRLFATHFDLLVPRGPEGAGALLAGLVRQSLSEFMHPELAPGDVASATSLVARALPKALRSELSPFATEIAFPFPLQRSFDAVLESAARVGLLACGDAGVALRVLLGAFGPPSADDASPDRLDVARLRATPVAVALFDFALSPEHDDLVRAVETAS